MARLPYSTRFISSAGLSGTASYTVPAGKRAVVKQVGARCGSAVAATILLKVAGAWAAGTQTPDAGANAAALNGSWVAYAGEVVTIYTSAACDVYVGGFLFDDP